MADEYIKRKDALREMRLRIYVEPEDVKIASDAVCYVPAADVAPVVRCRDCRWRHDDSYPMWLPCVEVETDPDWFCADGERREVQDGN